MSEHQRLPDPAISAVLELLTETYPKCFALFERRRRPLKIGIHEDILVALAGAVTPEELSAALRVYVTNGVYRSRLIAGATRIDLAGEPAGVVTPEQVPPPPRRIHKAAAPVKTQAESRLSAAADKPEKARLRLSLADLRAAAKLRAAGGTTPWRLKESKA